MDKNLQLVTVALLVMLILGVTWIAMQIQPISDLAGSRVGRALGGLGA